MSEATKWFRTGAAAVFLGSVPIVAKPVDTGLGITLGMGGTELLHPRANASGLPHAADGLKNPLSPPHAVPAEPRRPASTSPPNRMREAPLLVTEHTEKATAEASAMYLGADWVRSVRGFCAHYVTACSAMRAREYAHAYPGYLEAAHAGNLYAQFGLGVMYDEGRHVALDPIEAGKWFLLVAERGNPYAQHNIGLMYLDGRGVERDIGAGLRWIRASAEQGHALAQTSLGSLYASGTHVPVDFTQAARWLRPASEQGHAEAQYVYGMMKYHGDGMARDRPGAFRLLGLAAAQDHMGAIAILVLHPEAKVLP